jgi:O-antigen ligase
MNLLYPSFQIIITADVPHAHSVYFQTLAEMGYLGLILHLAFFIILSLVLIRQMRGAHDWRRPLAVGLLGSLAVFLIHGVVDVPNYSPLSAIVIWGLFGVMMAIGMKREA